MRTGIGLRIATTSAAALARILHIHCTKPMPYVTQHQRGDPSARNLHDCRRSGSLALNHPGWPNLAASECPSISAAARWAALAMFTAIRNREERYQPAHRKMTCRFGLRKRDFHAVHVERIVEPFQCNAPDALQAQLFACAQLRNRVGD